MPNFPDSLIAAVSIAAWREPVAAIAALLAAGSILLGLWNQRRILGETTLVSAAGWSAAAAVAIAAVEALEALSAEPSGWIPPLRFCAAALVLCPIVSVLGSKRPQHLPWNFVVLSLWGILSLNALTALAMQRTGGYVLGDARAWLLWVLIFMGLANYLPTRNWLAALLIAIGQVLLFAPHLPLLRGASWLQRLPAMPSCALVSFAVGLAVVRWSSNSTRGKEQAQSFDRLWLDFRDLFGLLWGLRMQERVNAASTAAKWGVQLNWNGLEPGEVPAQHRLPLRQAMTGLLRRFVSHEWIAARLEEDVD